MPCKKKCQMIHLKYRWADRVGGSLTQKTYDDILFMIKNYKTKLIHKQSNRVSIHEVKIENKTIKVVYDKLRSQIVTVIPIGEEKIHAI